MPCLVANFHKKEGVEDVRDGYKYSVAHAGGYYKLWKCTSNLSYSEIEWCDESVKLVAIDGQHRLSALMRMRNELAQNPQDNDLRRVGFEHWRIPIVVVIPFPKAKRSEPDILDGIRKLFVTINTSAQIPTRARRILLTDDELTSVCCQELLDWCHFGKAGAVPLELFDWRASAESGQPGSEAPLALLRVDEVADLHANYLLGEDEEGERITSEQAAALLLDGKLPKLRRMEAGKFWGEVREAYRKTLMAGVLTVFREMKALAAYIDALQEVASQKDDITKHALSRMRYGKSYEDLSERPAVDQRYQDLSEAFKDRKEAMPEVLQLDLGYRAIFYSLGSLKGARDRAKRSTSAWKAFAADFVEALNAAYADKWLDRSCKYLRHAAFDANGTVVNYRLGQVEKGLGAVLALAVGSRLGLKSDTGWAEEYLETLEATYQRGFAREVRPQIESKNPKASRTRVRELIHSEAQKKAKKLLGSLKKDLKLG